MTDWTGGYVADIDYIFGYYPELNPLRVKLAFLQAGLACPGFGTACELGFGQGISANIHACASLTQWSGTDFNPSQAAFAREMAAASGSDAGFYDQAFCEFTHRSDLPDFDYIGLHGVWSWVSDENRTVIVDFIRRKLKVGGVLYISYNTLPGMAAMMPMRDMLAEYVEVMGSPGQGRIARIDAALLHAERLLATQPIYAQAYPLVAEGIRTIQGQNRHYVAHEYFNRDWKPMSFADMRKWLEPAKLSFATSANYLDSLEAINLTPKQQALLKEIPHDMLRQTMRDFMVNQHFRRDYWVRGARKLSQSEQADGMRSLRVVLTTHRMDVALKVAGARGEISLNAAIYGPILDAMGDHTPKTPGQLESLLKDKGISAGQINQAILALAGVGHVCAAQDDATIAGARKGTDKLNAFIVGKARHSDAIGFLASPVTGGGLQIDRVAQLFILAMQRGKKLPVEWAKAAGDILASQGQLIVKDGKTLATPEESLAELTAQAEQFSAKQLPVLKALQIVEGVT